MEIKLDAREAYVAMFNFIIAFWERDDKPDNLRMLISSMQLLKGEKIGTHDPAQWHDWLDAIEKANIDPDSATLDFEMKPR